DAVLTTQAWNDLLRINEWVNDTVKPMTDLEHWGVAERWNYPDDGYGDCEDYVLLKRRMLMQAGWPPQALLITVVRDEQGDGHADPTKRHERAKLIYEKQTGAVLLGSKTGSPCVRGERRDDPIVGAPPGAPARTPATATSR